MNCKKCGAILRPNDRFCTKCGAQVQEQNQAISGNEVVQNGNIDFAYGRPTNQQMNYNTQQVNNNSNGGQNTNSKNSGNIIKIAIIIVLILAVIGAFVLLFYAISIANKDNKDDGRHEKTTNTIAENTTTTKKPESTYTVKLDGFELYIPKNLIYEQETVQDNINVLKISNEDDTWMAEAEIIPVSYQKAKSNRVELKSSIIDTYKSYDPIVSDPKIENIDGTEYVIIEAEIEDQKMLFAYGELNPTNCIAFTIQSEDTFDRDALKELAQIAANSCYVGNTSNIKVNTNITMNDVKAILEHIKANV